VTGERGDSVVTIPADGVLDARLVDGGFAALVDDGACRVEFSDGASVALGDCAVTSMTADHASGEVFLAGRDGIVRVGRGDARDLGAGGAVLAWDDTLAQLVVSDGGTITVMDRDGDVRWSAEVDGVVRAVHAMGRFSAVAAMVENPNGTGSIAFFDGDTGAQRSEGRIPSIADMTISDDGGRLALILDDTTHFYAVTEGPRPFSIDVDIPEPQVATD
jgi:hypothetical protein